MAGENYKLLIEGELSTDKITSKITALQKQLVLNLNLKVDDATLKKLYGELNKIGAAGGKINKIRLFEDDKGRVARAVIQYTNALGQAEKTTKSINESVKATKERYLDINRVMMEQIKLYKQADTLAAKQKDEMARAALNADKFLERSKNLNKTPSVQAAIGKAQEIKVAVSDGDIAKVRKLNDEFALMKARLQTGRTGLDSWTEGMKNALKQTMEYALSIGLVYGALNQLKKGIGYVSELNKELTNIQLLQIEGARTGEQVANLGMQYNTLAKELGATTVEVTKGSVEWLRQGKTIEQTQQLLRSSMMASKLGALDSAEATEYLTAILNGFQMESEEAMSVVDRLIAVDNIAATSFSELARAMQYSAAIANQTGVSFNNLVGYIATVSSTTRLAPEMIGQAFKTIMTRFTNVKAGATTEDGMSLNNIEKVLGSIGIQVRDTANSFRPLEDVIGDIAEKWDELSEVQKGQVNTAVAGARQSTIFAALMDNFGDVQKYVTEQTNAAGLAQDRYAIYLESVEAAQNRLTASWEKMWQSTVQSGAITWFLDLASAILDVISAGGGLQPVLTMILGAFILIKSAAIADTFTMFAASVSQAVTRIVAGLKTMSATALTTGMTMNTAFGLAGVALIAISAALIYFNNQADAAMKKASELSGEITKLYTEQSKLAQDTAQIKTIGIRYEELKDKGEERNNEEDKEYLDIQNQLHRLMPELNGYYDEQGNFILDNATNLTSLIALKNEELRINKENLRIKLNEQIEAQTKAYTEQQNKLQHLIETQKKQQDAGTARIGGALISNDDIDAQKLVVDDLVNQMQMGFLSLDQQQQQAQLAMLQQSGEFGQQLAEQLQGLVTTYEDASDMESMYAEKAMQNVSGLRLEYVELMETIKSTSEMASTLGDAISKSKSGELEFGDLEKISQVYPDYLKSLSIENGQLKLNTDMVREYMLAQIESSIATARANGATEEQVQVLKAQANELARSISFSKDFVNNFNSIMAATSEGLSGDAKDKFDQLATSISTTNEQFRNGQMDAIEYFNVLEQQLSSANFEEMFAENQGAAQSFFTGMVTNAGQALYQMTSEFDAGEIGLVEYMDRMKELGDVFSVIGEIVTTSGEQMGMSTEQIANITASTDGLMSSISELAGMYDLVNLSIAGMSQNLQFGSQEYLNWANTVSQAMAAVGGTWTDAAGNALNGADAIYNYATGAAGNMTVLMNQIVSRVNGIIQKATSNIATFLRGLAEGIRNFKGEIFFTPKLGEGATVSIGIPGLLELPFTLPSLGLEIGADFSGAADFIGNMANNIEEWGASEPIDLGDFISPGGLGATSDAIDAINSGLGGTAQAAKKAADAVDDMKDKIDEAKKAAIESLREQLKAYKKIIDARKKLLQSMLDERQYQQELESKNSEILAIQNELAALQFDTSEEAAARRAQLEAELAEAEQELEDMQYEHSIEEQQDALDEEYARFEEAINRAIERIQDMDVTTLKQFAKKLAKILAQLSLPQGDTEEYHEGGVVAGKAIKSNEVFAKLLKGEVVVTADQADNFLKNILPNLATPTPSNNNSNLSVEMPLQVMGNLDRSVLPDVEEILDRAVKKINDAMLSRGYNRRADLFQI